MEKAYCFTAAFINHGIFLIQVSTEHIFTVVIIIEKFTCTSSRKIDVLI